MRKFSITVNGQAYEVEVEEIGGAPVFAPAPVAAPAQAPAPVAAAPVAAAPVAAPAAKPAPTAAAGGEPVKAPMPGTILGVKVSVGQAIKKGDVLVILEAMKLENEIVAARDGVVASIAVAKGSTVNSGDLLLSLS